MSLGYTRFELNCDYHFQMSYKENVDPRFKSKLADKLSAKLKELMIICQKNFYYAQEFQKQAYNKVVKLRSYATNIKV